VTSARGAKNKNLEADAWAIRQRAERRVGEMMAEPPKAKGGGNGSNQCGNGSNQYSQSNRVSENPVARRLLSATPASTRTSRTGRASWQAKG
jgi:hypothetical protein